MANIITLSRIFMIFIVAALLFWGGQASMISALVLTGFVMWFDGLDGYVARKFNETSKLGAVLDIMGDRIVENVFWITFCALGWINAAIPIIVLTRGIVTDSLRSLALAQGFTAFGEKTMMQGKVAKFIVASNFSRFTYAVCKAIAFVFLIAGHLELNTDHTLYITGLIAAYISVVFCVLRGLPVVFEAKRFLKD